MCNYCDSHKPNVDRESEAEPMDGTSAVMDRETIFSIRQEIHKIIVGQRETVDRILIGLLTGGHILLEGVPGLAKSLVANTIARAIGAEFKRIQFTPDLLPADIVGTEIYKPHTGEFVVKKGPIFSNLVLADEINRAPAKVQSALLEAMQEKQVTIGESTYALDEPFLVLATQNPLEQQGTYPLPEAQQDRFMLKLIVTYPRKEEERAIIGRFTRNEPALDEVRKVVGRADLLQMRKDVDKVYVDRHIEDYVLDIVFRTREPSAYIACGASPRASINLIKAAKGKAYLDGRGYVTPDDIKALAYDVLRHRIALSYEAEAEDVTPEQMIADILDRTDVP